MIAIITHQSREDTTDQALVLLGKLNELALDDQADACEQLHEQAERLYQNLAESLSE
ncbi:Rop family plasmid primer RNA-binding protein [unidentified bacterial endosymbiont]|uniref:Rop family plasmid primer RNA-binding protein n=1 Tax=unidentified bacterial endosymbiont TaxID=2355 RepID=UPI00209CAB7D|nr:Rop family plasmid primer RNA-binding protein [unidentified bacterial endosymbiont]